jgi:DNA-binding transcriptional LysR family regulator
MTLVQLRHFIDLAQTGSFSSSAQRLHITQPALSRSILSLEDEFGQALFDRIGRKNELTAFGRQVVERARVLVEQADELRQSTVQTRQGLAGQIRIGLGSGPGALLTVPLLQHMATRAPQARIQIARGSTDLLVRALRERSLDALVVDIRALKPEVDLQVEAFPELPAAFMCHAQHPLRAQRQVSFAALRQYPIASTPLSDEVARLLVERYGTSAHPEQLVTLRCDEISSLLEVGRRTDTIVLAVRAVAPDLHALPVKPALNATARLGLVTMAGRSQAPLMTSLRPLIEACLKG